MKKSILSSLYAGYLGAGLTYFCGLFLDDWKYWAIVIPTILLEVIWNEPKY